MNKIVPEDLHRMPVINAHSDHLSIPSTELEKTTSWWWMRTNGATTMLMNYGHNNLSNHRETIEVSGNVPPLFSFTNLQTLKAAKWISN